MLYQAERYSHYTKRFLFFLLCPIPPSTVMIDQGTKIDDRPLPQLHIPADDVFHPYVLLCQEIVQNKVRKSRQISKEVDAMESVEKERRLFHTSHSETTATGAYAQQPS